MVCPHSRCNQRFDCQLFVWRSVLLSTSTKPIKIKEKIPYTMAIHLSFIFHSLVTKIAHECYL